MSERKRIAFVCDWDASNPNLMSGASFYMRKAFIDAGHDVVDIFPTSASLLAKAAIGLSMLTVGPIRLAGQYANPKRTKTYVAAASRVAQSMLDRAGPVDFVFSQSALPMGLLRTERPMVMTADQPFLTYTKGYVSNPAPSFIRDGEWLQRSVAERSTYMLYPSDWAREAFQQECPQFAAKSLTIPWGGNLRLEPAPDQVAGWIAQRSEAPRPTLTFIGRDWNRKGGDIVSQTVDILRSEGIEIQLNIIGCTPELAPHESTQVIASLDKQTPEGWEAFTRIMAASTLLFVPSRAEAYGHVFCEAAAFGIPSASAAVGGIPSIITHGENGILLPLSEGPASFAAAIRQLCSSRESYRAVANGAYRRYRERLSWKAFAEAVVNLPLLQR